ncbi:MAG: hypothetical protein ACPIOQ_84880, partial [Promethearchaeia archaeon]
GLECPCPWAESSNAVACPVAIPVSGRASARGRRIYLSCHDAKGREIYLLWHDAESRATSVLGMVQGKIKMFIMGAGAAPSFQTNSSRATSPLGV